MNHLGYRIIAVSLLFCLLLAMGCTTAPTQASPPDKKVIIFEAPAECTAGYMLVDEDNEKKVVAPLIVCLKKGV